MLFMVLPTENSREPLTLESLTSWIKTGTNFIFEKRGDGELDCLKGKQGKNCDGQSYTPELKAALASAYAGLENLSKVYPRCFIVEWGDPFSILHQQPNDKAKIRSFWLAVALCHRPKVFIGPERLIPVIQFLHTSLYIGVPSTEAYSADWLVRPALIKALSKDSIFIFSSGLASKVWCNAIASSEITVIDAGSAFDPLFVGTTRTMQWSPEECRNLYKL
jgi:hypothetical protein